MMGCTDSNACNYLPSATLADESCEYPNPGYDCFDICIIDTDQDGVCDDFEKFGCTEPVASNYNDDATEDDASCIIYGCRYTSADNFNPMANEGDNSFIFSGCTDPLVQLPIHTS